MVKNITNTTLNFYWLVQNDILNVYNKWTRKGILVKKYLPAYGHSFDAEAAIVEKKNAITVRNIVI